MIVEKEEIICVDGTFGFVFYHLKHIQVQT
jgi:hypothetical protein